MIHAPPRWPAAAFLDRDGTVIRHIHHLTDPERVELLPGAAEGISAMRSMGLKVVVCTNQSVVGRGLCTTERVDEVNLRMLDLLAERGAHLDGIVYCPHHPDDRCGCRKPAPGLGLQAARLVGVAPAQAVVMGDQPSDMEFGRALGATTVLIAARSSEDPTATYAAPDLLAAARWLEAELAARD